jgi:hypothetical protein
MVKIYDVKLFSDGVYDVGLLSIFVFVLVGLAVYMMVTGGDLETQQEIKQIRETRELKHILVKHVEDAKVTIQTMVDIKESNSKILELLENQIK